MKYLKEVTPYFRKASLLGELGWDLQKPYMGEKTSCEGELENNELLWKNELSIPGPIPESTRADTRFIPLTLAFITTNFKHHDPRIQYGFSI